MWLKQSYSSEISDGNRHNYNNMPVLLAGGGAGAFRSGRHLVYSKASVTNAYVSIMHAMGLNESRFGSDGDGPVPELT